MATVFVNFRNGDDSFAAALVQRLLAQRLGRAAVFRSSESIPPGSRWAEVIWENHRDCAALVAVIGPRWSTVTDERGQSRLHQAEDWVRAEIAAALGQQKLVIPVLLDGVPRLRPAELPESIAALADLQSIRLDHRHLDVAIDQLIERIGQVAPLTPLTPQAGGPDRDPGGWLDIWNLPARNASFVERDGPTRELRDELIRARAGAPVVLYGGVGCGKTQLAVEYAHRFAGDYQLAWWISGEPPELIPAQLAELAQAAGFEVGRDIDSALPALFAQLRRRGRWLVVFDGIDDPGTVAGRIAAFGAGGDTLITSRHPDWGLLQPAPRRLAGFDREQSVGLLAGQLGDADRSDLDLLAAALEDIPLAVAQAATVLPGLRMPPPAYAALLRTRTRALLDRGATYRYPGSLAAAWSLGLDLLTRATPPAAELLALLAVLGPAPVPVDILATGAAVLPAPLAAVAADPLDRADLVRAVARSGLVEVVDDAFVAHTLFQSFVRDGLDRERIEGLREMARQLLARADRGQPRDPRSWQRYGPLLPHAFALDLPASPDPACRQLTLDICQHLVMRADAATGRDLAGAALARWAAADPDSGPALAAAGCLAQAWFRLGDYPRALALDEDVLARRVRLSGADDPETLTAAHNVAMGRWACAGDRAAARDSLTEVVARRRRVLGPDHPDTLRSVHNLALAARAGRDLATAHDLDRETYRRLCATLGEDHPDTLRSAYALALDLRALGDAVSALTLEEDTLARLRRVLGPDHPSTLRSGYGLAVGLRATGEPRRARDLAEETYERRRRVLGEFHVDTARTGYLLGLATRDCGDRELGDRLCAMAARALRGSADTASA